MHRPLRSIAAAIVVLLTVTAAPPAAAAPDLKGLLVTATDFPSADWEFTDANGQDPAPAPMPGITVDPPECGSSRKSQESEAAGILGSRSDGATIIIVIGHDDGTLVRQTKDWIARCPSFTLNLPDSPPIPVQLKELPVPTAADGVGVAMTTTVPGLGGKQVKSTTITYAAQVKDIVATGMALGGYKRDPAKSDLDTVFTKQLAKLPH